MALLAKEISKQTYFDTSLSIVADKTTTSSEEAGASADGENLIGVPLVCNIRVQSVDDTTDDETYVLTVRTATDSGMTTNVVTERSLTIDNGTADDTHLFVKFIPTSRYIDVFLTVTGTTPSIVYDAWVSPER